MKKIFLVVAVALSALMVSCSSSDNDEPKPNVESLLKLPYSTLSPADQKTKLAAESETVLKQVEGLPNEASVKLLASFSEIFKELYYLLEDGESQDDVVIPRTNAETLVLLSEYYGQYEYGDEGWEKTKDLTDKLVAIFPATKESSKNDGMIEVTAEASDITINENQLPKKAVGTFYVDNKKVGDASLNTTGISKTNIIETANVKANLGVYTASVDVNKKGSANVIAAKFQNGNNVILNLNADLVANVTVDNLNNDNYASIKDGNFSMNLGDDLVLVGFVDGATLAPALEKIEAEMDKLYDSPWSLDRDRLYSELEKKQIDVINQNSNVALVSTKEGYKIAKASLHLYVANDYYYTETALVLSFSDNTDVAADVFFGSGFSKVVDQINSIWNKF